MKDSDWADVGDLIDRWSKRFPEDLAMNMQWVKTAKEGLDNEYGEGKTGDIRIGILVHPTLLNYIEKFHPRIFETNSNVKTFINKFPNFAVPEKF